MKYQGSCHCGNVQYEVDMEVTSAISCNCSICQKKGYLLSFAPADKFTLLKGEECLKDYQFNKKVIHHLFCTNCGVSSFGKGLSPDGKDMRAINIRCLENVDIQTIEVHHYDGKSL
ncbi:MAG: GFA family protein [Bdellovibrionota bacterium]